MDTRNKSNILDGKSVWRRSLGARSKMLEDNIKVFHKDRVRQDWRKNSLGWRPMERFTLGMLELRFCCHSVCISFLLMELLII